MAASSERKIEYLPLASLQVAAKNPKLHADAELQASVTHFGYAEPIVIDERTGRIVAGHGRREALLALKTAGNEPPDGVRKKNGDWLIPVMRGWASKTDADAEAYLLASNRLVEVGGWDDAQLAEMLAELFAANGPTVSDIIGFSAKDLRELEARVALEAGGATEDNVPAAPKDAVAKPGDLWLLGEHRLLCGDATKAEDVARLLGDGKAELFITDPPYGVSYADKNAFLNTVARGNHIQTPIEGDHQTVGEMGDLWLAAFKLAFDASAPGACYYVTGPQGGDLSMMMMMMMQKAGWLLKHVIVWAKNNHVLGRCDYHYKHEPILYGWKPGAAHYWAGGNSEVSLWEIDKPTASALHPTMKPVELFARAMRNSSQPGGVVLDLFAGSGTAVVAAEQLGRKCRAMELDARYCDVIVERWENQSGGKAVRGGI